MREGQDERDGTGDTGTGAASAAASELQPAAHAAWLGEGSGCDGPSRALNASHAHPRASAVGGSGGRTARVGGGRVVGVARGAVGGGAGCGGVGCTGAAEPLSAGMVLSRCRAKRDLRQRDACVGAESRCRRGHTEAA